MNISPHLKLTFSLVMLVASTVFVADFLELLPRPEEQVREARKLLGEGLAVQLSSAVARQRDDVVFDTLDKLVTRNDEILHAGLYRRDGTAVVEFGRIPEQRMQVGSGSSLNHLVIPIFQGQRPWGEVRLSFATDLDWGLHYLGFPTQMLKYLAFLVVTCMFTFYIFMRRALTEMNPSKVVPQRVNAAFDVLAEGVLIIDEKQHIVLANQSFAARVGADPGELVGRDPDTFAWDLKGDGVEMLPWQVSLTHGEPVQGMPLRLTQDEQATTFTVNSAPIRDDDGRRRGCLVTFDDVTPLEAKNAELASMLAELSATQSVIEEKNKELEVLAMRDALTGVLNRRSFMEKFKAHFAGSASKQTPLCVMMVDIDHFKQVNDNYGHPVGDLVIKQVAQLLDSAFRSHDAVGRYGGEEFVISLPGTQLKTAIAIAERTRVAVEKLVEGEDLPMPSLSVSIGVATLTRHVKDGDELLDQADRGLYKAKQTGRNQVCAYDPDWESSPEPASDQVLPQSSTVPVEDPVAIDDMRGYLKSLQTLVQKQAKEITHQAMHDTLTGLPNRFLLMDRLNQAMKQSARNDNLTAVVSISLSSFDFVHDQHGAGYAEQLLREASTRLENVVREVDTIGVTLDDRALTCSRISQNELALLIVDLDDAASMPKIVDRICRAMAEPLQINDIEVPGFAYCGIALYPNDGDDAESLVRNASLARNHAMRREDHSSTSAYFSDELDELAIKNASIAKELRGAIENDGLHLVYQPKIELSSGRLTGLEALVRWEHTQLGRVGPMEFVAVAEQIGLIDQLTNWVVKKVCEHFNAGVLQGIRVSVNVSPIELHDAYTSERLMSIMRANNVAPSSFEIEITETSMLNNFDLARSILDELRGAGVTVALDDFGTGYSSLNLLREMPVDVIKIDRSFVTQIHETFENQAVVGSIVRMAKTMGKRIVAEGVENIHERDCLIELGCDEIQGYFHAKPMELDDLQTYLWERQSVESITQQGVA